jgi:hypothetical protein
MASAHHKRMGKQKNASETSRRIVFPTGKIPYDLLRSTFFGILGTTSFEAKDRPVLRILWLKAELLQNRDKATLAVTDVVANIALYSLSLGEST